MADIGDDTLSEGGEFPQEPEIIESDKFEYTKADFKLYKLTKETDFNHFEPETQILHIHKGNKYLEGLEYNILPTEKLNNLAPRILYSIQRGDFGILNYLVDYFYTNFPSESIDNETDGTEEENTDSTNENKEEDEEEGDGDGDEEEKKSDDDNEEENLDEIGEGISKDEKYEIRQGNTKVKALLNTISDAQGKNMLHYAIEYDQYKLFLKIMHLAVENDMFETLLFKQDKRNGWTCFTTAVIYRRFDILQWIIDKFLLYPTSSKKFTLLQELILCESFAKRHSLHWAITKQYDDIIILLLKTLHKIGYNILEKEEETIDKNNRQTLRKFFKVYYEEFDYETINYEENTIDQDLVAENEESKEEINEFNEDESKEESKE